MPRRAFTFAALSVLFAVSAEAATVQVNSGPVFINQGQGFQRIATATTVVPGDVAMAGTGGSGQLVYDDGCRVDIAPGSTVAVQDKSPCRRGGAPWFNYALGATLVGGTIAAIIVTEEDDGPVSP